MTDLKVCVISNTYLQVLRIHSKLIMTHWFQNIRNEILWINRGFVQLRLKVKKVI